jgi:hypothetical protein
MKIFHHFCSSKACLSDAVKFTFVGSNEEQLLGVAGLLVTLLDRADFSAVGVFDSAPSTELESVLLGEYIG